MRFSVFHGAAAGAIVTGAIVAFVLRPAALAPAPALSTATADQAAATHHRDAVVALHPHERIVVYVAGAVRRPGLYRVASDARAFDAVQLAGGLAGDADAAAVNLAARVSDGDEIAVPRLGDQPADATPNHKKRAHKGHQRHAKRRPAATLDDPVADAPAQRIDLNSADAGALATIPGIGPTLAARIVEFRAVNGPFASVDGLADVSGVSASRFDEIASYLTVGRP